MVRSIMLVCAMFLFLCDDNNSVDPEKKTGDLTISIQCEKVGNLGKSRTIELSSLIIELEANSENIIYDTIAISGYGTNTVVKEYFDLTSGKVWNIRCYSIDQNGFTIHEGSDTVTIFPDSTSTLNFALNSMFSMIIASYYPIADSCNRCVLTVDSVILADSIFNSSIVAVGDTVSLTYDYLTASEAGILHNFKMDVYGQMWGADTLLYSGDTSIVVVSGVDSEVSITLNWVGPDIAPDGNIFIVVDLGAISKTIINGEITKD